MKDYPKAMEAAGRASEADHERKHATEIDGLVSKVNMALASERAGETEEQTLQRAMRDPEVAVRSFDCRTTTITTCSSGHHDRPSHAIDPSTGTGGPICTSRAYEESYDTAEDHETGSSWCH